MNNLNDNDQRAVAKISWLQQLKEIWSHWTQGLHSQAVFIFIFSTVILILFHDNCSTTVFRTHFSRYFSASDYRGMYPYFFWYGCSFVLLFVIPLVLGKLVCKRSNAQWGLALGDWKFGLRAVLWLYAAFLPILVLVSYLPSFQAKYPLCPDAKLSVVHFLVYQLSYMAYFVGWEFIFRGFILFGLRPHIGHYAVFVQTIPFAIMHFGKPQLETLSAVIAGVLLGYLALRTRSFLYGWLLHSLVAATNDFLAIIQKLGS